MRTLSCFAMPLEGHYQRVNTPLRTLTVRERRVALWGTAIAAVTILALILATAGGGRPALGAGCINPTVAGRTGGEPVNACGAEAVQVCRRAAASEGPWAESVLGACLEREIKY